MISRSGKCPWRTSRCWPTSVKKPEFRSRKSEISASMACAKSFRAPLRKTSVSGSSNVPGSANLTILSWVTAYLPLMESGGSNTPTIRRLTSLRRHQLLPIAHGVHPRCSSPAGKGQPKSSQGGCRLPIPQGCVGHPEGRVTASYRDQYQQPPGVSRFTGLAVSLRLETEYEPGQCSPAAEESPVERRRTRSGSPEMPPALRYAAGACQRTGETRSSHC